VNFLSIYKRCLVLALVAVLALQCAQPSSPSGGAKDENPPVILRLVPENEMVNFTSKTIEILFDEYIQLKDPSNQILISPSLKEKPVFTVKNKTLIVEIADTLQENTTYSINFGESIVDNNEGNILKNFVYAFSTGDELDSLEISGKVRDAVTGAPVENMKIQLYRTHSDSIPLLEKPNYFVQTDKNGFFKIQYLPETTFKLFGCSDENGTLVYEEPTENICFLDSLIDLSLIDYLPNVILKDSLSTDSLSADSLSSDSLSLVTFSLVSFNEEADLGYLDELQSDSLGVYTCTFSAPQKDLKIQTSVTDSLIYLWKDDTQKELMFFTLDTGAIIFTRGDNRFTNRETLRDTLELEPIDSSLYSDSLKYCKLEYLGDRTVFNEMKLRFRASRPLNSNSVICQVLQKDSLIDQIDSLTLINSFDFELSYSGTIESNYEFRFIPGTLKANGLTNRDTTRVNVSTFPENHFGELILDIQSSFINPYVILKQKSGKIIYQAPYEPGALTLDQVPPGEVELFLLEDLNNDKKWTTGNYLLNLQPERYIQFNQKLEVRSNWSLSYTWVLD